MGIQLKQRRRLGYTLIEVMVAVVLLTIALPGLVVMVVGSRKAQLSSLRMDQASSYGQFVIDELGLLPATARPAGTGTSSAVIGGTTYAANWTIPAASGGSYTVPVTVSWTQGTKVHSVTLQGVLR